MQNVIIVSQCLRVTKMKNQGDWYQFHFKGAFAGQCLSKVFLKAARGVEIKKGEEYLLFVQVLSCDNAVLKGHILKAKRLEDCWDRS